MFHEILEKLKHMEERIMSQLDDVNAALTQLDADTQALVAEQTKAFADLEAAVAAGKTGPDLSPIVTRLQANHTALVQALAAAQSADATTQPPAPPAPPAA